MAATRDAIGMPTQECRPSTLDVYRGNVPGPSMGGQGAEFRETPAQLDRYEVRVTSSRKCICSVRVLPSVGSRKLLKEGWIMQGHHHNFAGHGLCGLGAAG